MKLKQLVGSVLASLIGVQSREKLERDSHGMRLRDFVIAGFVMAALLYLGIYGIVQWVAP